MEYGIAILALGVVVLGFLLLRAKEKLGENKATIERDDAENEIKEENRKAAWSNLDTINKLDDANVKQLLKDKWTRK